MRWLFCMRCEKARKHDHIFGKVFKCFKCNRTRKVLS